MSYYKLPWQYGHLGAISVGGGLPTPVFEVDFSTGTIVPTIGTAGSFSRASSVTYYDTTTTIATQTSGNPTVGSYALNGSGDGLQIAVNAENLLLYSEDLSNAVWTAVGTATITPNVASFLTNISYGTISAGANNDGVTQTSGTTVTSYTEASFSVYLSCASGTVAATLTIAGNGAVPGTTTKSVTVTTTPQRFFVGKDFSSASTGTLVCTVTVDNAGDIIRFGGAQLEVCYLNGTGLRTSMKTPRPYIKTTSATATTARDLLAYTGTELTSIQDEFTLCVWFRPGAAYPDIYNNYMHLIAFSNATAQPAGLRFYPSVAGTAGRWSEIHIDNVQARSVYMKNDSLGTALVTDTWYFGVYVYKKSVPTIQSYLNGTADTLVTEVGTGSGTPITWAGLYIGGGSAIQATREYVGGFGKVSVYDQALSAADILTLFNDTKADYGY